MWVVTTARAPACATTHSGGYGCRIARARTAQERCRGLLVRDETALTKRPAHRRPLSNIITRQADQTAAVIHWCNFCFGAAPTWREAISPPLKIIKVGIDITPYFEAVFGLSSTLSFTILTLSPIAPAISSSAGAIMRQGPHHSAQKSTTTGPVALSTSDSKSASETLPTAMGLPRSVGEKGAAIESHRGSWVETYERGVAGSSARCSERAGCQLRVQRGSKN